MNGSLFWVLRIPLFSPYQNGPRGFPQRFVGVILGASLAVVLTAIFLPELERIQEFELWIFGCSFINYRSQKSAFVGLHLLRQYGAAVLAPKRQYGGLPRENLLRAVEYIQDQLSTDLTVSAIAQAVCVSPHHFTKLFKVSTGQSPHQYVVEARVRKAKELLTTGKFTISEPHTMSVSSIRAILHVISKEFSAYLLIGY